MKEGRIPSATQVIGDKDNDHPAARSDSCLRLHNADSICFYIVSGFVLFLLLLFLNTPPPPHTHIHHFIQLTHY